jgi:hypothetical protein
VRVAVANKGVPLEKIRVTAIRDDGVTVDATSPVTPGRDFVFYGLKPGSYKLRASSPGFDDGTGEVTAPAAQTVKLTLTPRHPLMPFLFASTLTDALGELKKAGIANPLLLDVTGREVSAANPAAEYRDAPVLVQYPAAGDPVLAGKGATLVVAAALRVESSVEMPSLVGLSLSEAQKALEAIGLVMGKVVTKTRKLI